MEPPASEPPLSRKETRHLLWGDVHIHTSLSYDAYVMGARVMPEDAYRFAAGETIGHSVGYPVRLPRPLDFAAVTDHAEYLGVARHLELNGTWEERTLRDLHLHGGALAYTWHYLRTLLTYMADRDKKEADYGKPEYEAVSRDSWQQIQAAANRHYRPGVLTTFIGYEWSSIPENNNLHRNVIYRGDRVAGLPFSARDSSDPQDLWDALDAQRDAQLDVIAIPHNGNSSNGKMYAALDYGGGALSPEYAEQRMRNEPLSEIYQVKGSSESHPLLSPLDEFADFEIYDTMLSAEGGLSNPEGSYSRDALKTGLEFAHARGFNPYRFGVIGSSDSHNASSPVDEDSYHGKMPMLDGSPTVRLRTRLLLPEKMARGSPWSAQGLAAVWAVENTREAIFEAMRRKETYASSGPRIALRFFAGWHYEEGLLAAPDRDRRAYAGGVPMGGSLFRSPDGDAPVLAVWASKDPLGANLDRIQVIKASVGEDGEARERIFNVAVSNPESRVMEDGRVLPVGNTVDTGDATYTNTIGAEALAVVWRDPDFDPATEAFYYARVIEIPTPRWSTYDAVQLGVEPPLPATLQERAVSSAIWYDPGTRPAGR